MKQKLSAFCFPNAHNTQGWGSWNQDPGTQSVSFMCTAKGQVLEPATSQAVYWQETGWVSEVDKPQSSYPYMGYRDPKDNLTTGPQACSYMHTW